MIKNKCRKCLFNERPDEFDDFTETSFSSGVREAIMHMILNGDINLERYEIIPVQNVMGAGATYIDDNFFYDWQAVMSNEFVLRKLIWAAMLLFQGHKQ